MNNFKVKQKAVFWVLVAVFVGVNAGLYFLSSEHQVLSTNTGKRGGACGLIVPAGANYYVSNGSHVILPVGQTTVRPKLDGQAYNVVYCSKGYLAVHNYYYLVPETAVQECLASADAPIFKPNSTSVCSSLRARPDTIFVNKTSSSHWLFGVSPYAIIFGLAWGLGLAYVWWRFVR